MYLCSLTQLLGTTFACFIMSCFSRERGSYPNNDKLAQPIRLLAYQNPPTPLHHHSVPCRGLVFPSVCILLLHTVYRIDQLGRAHDRHSLPLRNPYWLCSTGCASLPCRADAGRDNIASGSTAGLPFTSLDIVLIGAAVAYDTPRAEFPCDPLPVKPHSPTVH